MMNYELVIIWENGEKDIYKYDSEDRANRAGEEMKFCFGNQISWYGTRRARA